MNRRQFLVAGGTLLSAFPLMEVTKAMAKELGKVTPPGFDVPYGAVDCHVHIFDPVRFPYSPKRRYTPRPATVTDLRRFHDTLHFRRTVLVQPSPYGTNNACLLDALKQLGKDARAIAVVDEKISAQQLDDFAAAGVRGVRLNLEVGKERNLDLAATKLKQAAEKIAGRGWIIQIYAALPVLAGLATRIGDLPNQVIIDHFGMAKTTGGVHQDGFSALTSLMQSGKAYVKLSAPYQISRRQDYCDVAPIAKALIEEAPNRTLWGSDWPHPAGSKRRPDAKPTDIEPFRQEDDGYNLGLVKTWAPDPNVRQKLFTDNPSKLFGFDM